MAEDDDEIELHDSQAEAIEAAIRQVRLEGGGFVWIHREECNGEEECECDPVEVYVEGSH